MITSICTSRFRFQYAFMLFLNSFTKLYISPFSGTAFKFLNSSANILTIALFASSLMFGVFISLLISPEISMALNSLKSSSLHTFSLLSFSALYLLTISCITSCIPPISISSPYSSTTGVSLSFFFSFACSFISSFFVFSCFGVIFKSIPHSFFTRLSILSRLYAIIVPSCCLLPISPNLSNSLNTSLLVPSSFTLNFNSSLN